MKYLPPDTSSAQPESPEGVSLKRLRTAALRISLVYLIIGLVWIGFSDRMLNALVRHSGDHAGVITALQTIKGMAFVVVTAGILYALIRHFSRSIEETTQRSVNLADRYQMLFDRNPFAMWLYDSTTLKILAVNECAVAVYGYSRQEFLALRITDLRPVEQVPRLLAYLPTLASGDPNKGVWLHRRKDGSLLHVEVVSRAIDFDGHPARMVMALDITERLKTEQALEDYRTQLEERVESRTFALSTANRQLQEQVDQRRAIEVALRSAKQIAEEASIAKSAFLANTTHEIRTPLTSILGYTDLLVDRDLTLEERERYVTIVRQNAAHLLKMIDDLLDLSRIETGNLRVTLEDHSPVEIAEQTLELLRPRAAAKRLPLKFEQGSNVPPAIRTDGVRLRQVLLNLLSNAIKFTHSGSITLSLQGVETLGSGPGSGQLVQFDLTDTGIGIGEENLAQIFEPFYQVQHGENRRYAGTGLGLAISKRLIEQMNGTLTVSSRMGAGSTFSVRIPLVLPPAESGGPESTRKADAALEGRVLLAEDNASIRWLVEEYLRRAGATVTSVADGAQAVEQVKAAMKDAAPFDLVLLDISMPGMDGPEALRHMRSGGYKGPIVALTAHAMSGEQSAWANAGWTAVAAKPIDQRKFIPLLRELLENRAPGEGAGVTDGSSASATSGSVADKR